LTDGEDLQLLLGRELNEDDDDDMSWEGISRPQRKKSMARRSRKTRHQEASYLAGHQRTMKKPMVASATAVTVAEMTAAMTTAATTTSTLAQPLPLSAARS
jgi:hypothetical protein